MTFRMSLLSLLCVGAVSTHFRAESMIKEVIGDSAPYFIGHVADDAAYGFRVVDREARVFGEEVKNDFFNFLSWLKRQAKAGGTPLLRTGWHSAKIAGGALLCIHSIPNELLGMDGYRGEVVPGWKRVVKHVPTRVAGLALIYHGVCGIARQWGFESFTQFYNFMEGRKEADQETVQKPKPSSAKQR